MIFGMPASEVVFLAAFIIVGGVITGLLAGLFGVGGGGVIVPVLYEIFLHMNVPESVRMQLCVGTSLAIIVPTSIRSFRAHKATGTLPVEILRAWTLPIAVGVIIGGLVAAIAPAWLFKISFVVMAGIMGTKFLIDSPNLKLGESLPGRFAMSVYGLVIGLYSALMGVGGGAVASAILVLYGRTIHAAVGIAAGVGVVISVVGTASFIIAGLPYQAQMPPLSVGYVSLIGVLLMAPITSMIAPYGARLAHRMPKRQLAIAFGIFLWLVALRFVYSLLG